MIHLCLLFNYTLRFTWRISIRHKVVSSVSKNSTTTCSEQKASEFIPVETQLYEWSNNIQDLFLSSYFLGYVLGHIPSGILSDLYGGKQVLGVSIIGLVVIAFFTSPFLSVTDGNYIGTMILQFITGIPSGMMNPSINSILCHWTPIKERTSLGSIAISAKQIATALSWAANDPFINLTGHWFSAFYLCGCFGILCCVLWFYFVYSHYSLSSFIGEKESNYLQNELGPMPFPKYIPWRQMMSNKALWALLSAHLGHLWIWHILLKYLPKYLKEVYKYDTKGDLMISSLPYLSCGVLTIIIGFLTDYWINTNCINRTTSRTILTTFGCMGPGIYCLAAAYAGCYKTVVIFLFVTGLSLMSFYNVGIRVNMLDLAPNFGGVVMTIVSGYANLVGIFMPFIMDAVMDEDFGNMKMLLWIFLIVLMITNVVYMIWGTSEEQSFNNIREKPKLDRSTSVKEIEIKYNSNVS